MELVPIGEFSATTRLSARALRLYADNGLLRPARVDPDSGYRYYQPEQASRARLIQLLRSAGMPLDRIRSFLAEPDLEQLDAYEADLVAELDERRRALAYIRAVVSQEERTMSYEVRVKDVPAIRYVGRKQEVSIGELGAFIRRSCEELLASVSPQGPVVVVYHGNVDEQSDGEIEVCVPTDGGEAELAPATVAFTVARGSQTRFPDILGAYDAVAEWATSHGHELICPPRETYLNDYDGPDAEVEISWPIGRRETRDAPDSMKGR
jgi:DNA-binding transcriptional MerR regulator